MAASNDTRPYGAAHFGLEFDKQKQPGFIRSIEGGAVKADVMTYQSGEHGDLWRQVGRPKYEDIKIQVGMSFSKQFYTWIEGFFQGKAERRSGAILAADFYFKERARREFFEAMISELAFPKLDAADKNPAFLTVTIAPERLTFKAGDGSTIGMTNPFEKEKLWTACNFELDLKGFEAPCARVTKIDAFSIKMKVIEFNEGARRDPIKVAGRLEFPNLVFYLPESDAQPFIDQVTKRVIGGERAPDARATGSITLLDNAADDLCVIDLYGCDVSGVTPDKNDAGSEEIKQVKVELAVERMEFKYVGSSSL